VKSTLLAIAAAVAAIVLAAASDGNQPIALAVYPDAFCAGDLRHLSWVWQGGTDGPKEAIADKLVASRMGVIVKSHDGTDWMSTYDHSPDAISGPAQVRRLADYYESRGVPFFTYAVVKGEDPVREGQMAAEVLNSGARGIFLDLEPWNGYWHGTPQGAVQLGQELRRLAPNGIVITTVEPRPWVVPNIPVAEFAAFSDAIATMNYWESFANNGQIFANWGYPPPPEGVTPEFLLDVSRSMFDRYNLPIMPIGQGASQETAEWVRFVDHSTSLGMPLVSSWRHGVTYPPVFDVLRDKEPAGWPTVCEGEFSPTFFSSDFNSDGRDDLIHLTSSDFIRPWASTHGSFNVGFERPWPGYWIRSGQWMTGRFNRNDTRDDLIHLPAGDTVNIWTPNRSGHFSVSSFRAWPAYGLQQGTWKTADINGDDVTDLVHFYPGDYVHTWINNGNGTFNVGTFRPWQNYNISGGSWEVGDFNGDGRDDLVHLTPGDYINIWQSRGDGTFAVGHQRPWANYGVQSGSWKTGDFNGDGRDDLVHLPPGDYVRPWLGRADGMFDVGYFQPAPGYWVHSGSWQAGDFNGDGRTDLVHLIPGDYVRPWISLGNGTFDVGFFSPSPGYWVHSGTWQTGDVNGDGLDDLIHFPGGDYIRPWVSIPTGGFSVGYFQPWPGYRM
jgi:hypothetical protein